MSFLDRPFRQVLRVVVAAGAVLMARAAARAETQAGHDKGFFIKSDAFEIHFGTRTQLQFSSREPDTFLFDSLRASRRTRRASTS